MISSAGFRGLLSQSLTKRSGLLKGSGFSRTVLTTLKIAVLAPTPRATVITATAVNPGDLKCVRRP